MLTSMSYGQGASFHEVTPTCGQNYKENGKKKKRKKENVFILLITSCLRLCF